MPHTHERIEFSPPRPPGLLRGLGLAVLAHLVLLAALTWGVKWKRQDTTLSAEAELWAAVPQQAAPKAAEAPPPPPPPVAEPVAPKVAAPAPQPPVEKPAPVLRDAEIALEKEKQKKKLQEAALEDERQEKIKQDKLKQDQLKAEKLKEDTLRKAADKKAQEAAQKKAAEEAAKVAQRKAVEDQQRAAAQAEQEAQQSAQQREAHLRRITGLAGASGGATATGSAQQSSGPSSGYGGRVKAKVKPNLVFTSAPPGNPKVTIEVRLAPDGTILGRPRVVKSSGNREWDEAVVRAFEKTEVLPRDTDGSVHSPLEVDWRVND